jgi:hypothetical protein
MSLFATEHRIVNVEMILMAVILVQGLQGLFVPVQVSKTDPYTNPFCK